MAQQALVRTAAREIDQVDERLVDRSVETLRRIVVESQVGAMLEVGEHVIENYYGGEEQARSRDPHKPASLRRLAERSDEFGMTATGVRCAAAVALQAQALGRPLALRLSIAHHRALLPLRDAAAKKLLAGAAADAGWSVKRLTAKLHKLQKKHKGGRPGRPPIETLVARLDRALDEDLYARRRELTDGIAAPAARALLAKLEGMQRRMELLERELVRLVGRKDG